MKNINLMPFIADDYYIVINPRLAEYVGLNEAIVIQHLHYWIIKNQREDRNYKDGRYWTFNTFEQWKDKAFKFWSVITIKRIFKRLETKEIVISEQHNANPTDRTKWYTLNYEKLQSFCCEENTDANADDDNENSGNEGSGNNNENTTKNKKTKGIGSDAKYQNDTMESIKMIPSIYTKNNNTKNINKERQNIYEGYEPIDPESIKEEYDWTDKEYNQSLKEFIKYSIAHDRSYANPDYGFKMWCEKRKQMMPKNKELPKEKKDTKKESSECDNELNNYIKQETNTIKKELLKELKNNMSSKAIMNSAIVTSNIEIENGVLMIKFNHTYSDSLAKRVNEIKEELVKAARRVPELDKINNMKITHYPIVSLRD